MASGGEEGRGKLRKVAGIRKRETIRERPNGATRRRARHSREGEPTRGTETSQYPEEKKEKSIPPVAASEEGRAQTGAVSAAPGLKERREAKSIEAEANWKIAPKRVKAPYAQSIDGADELLSRAGHEKSRPNPRGPSRKAKYSRKTDSEPVP